MGQGGFRRRRDQYQHRGAKAPQGVVRQSPCAAIRRNGAGQRLSIRCGDSRTQNSESRSKFEAALVRAMVGRERELASLLSGLDDAAARRGRLFLISGEPGVGKTRLADEVAAVADAKRMALLVGHCSEHDEAVAYLPFVEILENFVDRASDADTSCARRWGTQAPELARLLPKLKNILPELPPPLDFAAGSGAAPLVQLLFRLRRSNRFRTTDADDTRGSSLGRRFDFVAARSPDAAAFRSASDGDRHLPRRGAQCHSGLAKTLEDLLREPACDST